MAICSTKYVPVHVSYLSIPLCPIISNTGLLLSIERGKVKLGRQSISYVKLLDILCMVIGEHDMQDV